MTRTDRSSNDPPSFETLLAQIHTELWNVVCFEDDPAIEHALSMTAQFFDADRAVVWRLDSRATRLVNAHEVRADANDRPSSSDSDRTLMRRRYPWLFERVLDGQRIAVAARHDLPSQAVSERELFCAWGVTSIALLPLVIGTTTVAVLGVESRQRNPRLANEAMRLSLVAQAFSSMLERTEFEQALRSSEARYARALQELMSYMSNSPLAVIEWDSEMRVRRWSGRAQTIFGWTEAETVGQVITDFHMVVPDELLDEANEKLNRLRTGEIASYLARNNNYNRAGDVVHCDWYVSALRDDDGEVVSMLALVQDVTTSERQREELNTRRERLQEIVEEQSAELEEAQSELVKRERLAVLGQLTGSVAHELRNPLGTIHNSMLMLRRVLGSDDARVDRVLGRAERSVARTEAIINELTDYARRPQLERRRVDLDSWLHETVEDMQLPSTIEVSWQLGLSRSVCLEPERLQRLVVNLVMNAAEALAEVAPTDSRKITVATRVEEDRAVVEFTDSGPGISPERLKHIFEPLYSTKGFGVGLGLPIVEQIARQHGGEIEIRSQLGEGTNAILTLPLS